MRIAIHQPNFIPHFPYFEKMAMSDVFVILSHCQFEKNGFQNRQQIFGKWWTKPVKRGLVPIKDKKYSDGQELLRINMDWIFVMARTLGIDTSKIHLDQPTEKKGTERIIEICETYGADEYLADEEAVNKYLNKGLLEYHGIKFVPFKSHNRKHVFELFNEIGIEKTAGLLKHRERCEA